LKTTEHATLKAAQNQNQISINAATRRDIINIMPNSQQGNEKASKDEGWKMVSYKKHRNKSRKLDKTKQRKQDLRQQSKIS
jgi:hypothetical protein